MNQYTNKSQTSLLSIIIFNLLDLDGLHPSAIFHVLLAL